MGFCSTNAIEPLRSFHYPRVNEMPEDLVFLDDIVRMVNETHACIPARVLSNKTFTAPMAKNYLHAGITPAPIGRKYNRDHICIILFAATIKLVYKASQILAITETVFEGQDPKVVNDEFAEILEARMKAVGANQGADAGETKANLAEQSVRPSAANVSTASSQASERTILLELVASAFASKMASLTLIDNQAKFE